MLFAEWLQVEVTRLFRYEHSYLSSFPRKGLAVTYGMITFAVNFGLVGIKKNL